jgi:hypothetical protein
MFGNTPKTLSSLLGLQLLLSIGLFISACAVVKTANSGFNALLTGLLHIFFCIGGLYVTSRSQTSVGVGFLMGVGVMMCAMLLETAVFWGGLAKCTSEIVVSAEPAISVPIGDGQITGYSCTNKAAYRSVCAFASLLFIANVAFTAVLVRRKDEVIEGGGKATPASSAYTNVGAPAGGASPGFAQQGAAYNPGGYGGQGKSVADL